MRTPFLVNIGASCLLGVNQSGTPYMVYPLNDFRNEISNLPIIRAHVAFPKHNTGWYMGVYSSYVTIVPWSLIPCKLSRSFVAQIRKRRFSDPLNLGVSWQGHLAVWNRPVFALPKPTECSQPPMPTRDGDPCHWVILDLCGFFYTSRTEANIPVWRQLNV